VPAGGVEEAALWEHAFCTVLDMHLRGRGSVATLVDVLRSLDGEQPSRESAFMRGLIARWALVPDQQE
jgi:hypothetical protein